MTRGWLHANYGNKLPPSLDIGDGWLQLVADLCAALDAESKRSGWSWTCVQAKQKFAGLRFYVHVSRTDHWANASNFAYDIGWTRLGDWLAGNHKLFDIEYKFEGLSFGICEECGNPGQPRGGGWIRTLCSTCAKGIPALDWGE